MSEELIIDAEKNKILQVQIAKLLQDSAALAFDKGGVDIFTFLNTWIEIGKVYKKNAKKQFEQMAKDRKKFEKETEDLEKSYTTIADVDLVESKPTFIVTE